MPNILYYLVQAGFYTRNILGGVYSKKRKSNDKIYIWGKVDWRREIFVGETKLTRKYLEDNPFYVTHDIKSRDYSKDSFETLGINNVLALGKIMYDRYLEVTQQCISVWKLLKLTFVIDDLFIQ